MKVQQLNTSNVSEGRHRKRAVNEIASCRGLVVNHPIRDLIGWSPFKVAQTLTVSDRLMVYILSLFQENNSAYPKLSDVKIYKPRKGWGMV